MLAAPLPPGQGADGQRHAQAVALIVGAAPHLGVIPRGAQVLRPHLRIGLEAAATQDNRWRGNILDGLAIVDRDAHDGAVAVLDQGGDGGAIADFDAVGGRGGEPGIGQPHAFMQGPDDGALLPLHPVADANG